MDKGIFGVSPGERLSIAFKGKSATEIHDGAFVDYIDMVELFVTYDVRTTEITVKDGAKIEQ